MVVSNLEYAQYSVRSRHCVRKLCRMKSTNWFTDVTNLFTILVTYLSKEMVFHSEITYIQLIGKYRNKDCLFSCFFYSCLNKLTRSWLLPLWFLDRNQLASPSVNTTHVDAERPFAKISSNLLTYLLTYTMEHSPSSEANQ